MIGWTEDCQKAFKELKKYLSKPPILNWPEPEETLYLYLSVTPETLSSVLIREHESIQKLIYYVNHTLRGPEIRYSNAEKFALALIVTARKLRPYFQAHPIVVLTS